MKTLRFCRVDFLDKTWTGLYIPWLGLTPWAGFLRSNRAVSWLRLSLANRHTQQLEQATLFCPLTLQASSFNSTVCLTTTNGAYGYVICWFYPIFYSLILWQSDRKGHRVVRFENLKSAIALEDFHIASLRTSSYLDTTEQCNLDLIKGHLFFALLIHVRGFVKRSVARSRATSG